MAIDAPFDENNAFSCGEVPQRQHISAILEKIKGQPFGFSTKVLKKKSKLFSSYQHGCSLVTRCFEVYFVKVNKLCYFQRQLSWSGKRYAFLSLLPSLHSSRPWSPSGLGWVIIITGFYKMRFTRFRDKIFPCVSTCGRWNKRTALKPNLYFVMLSART